MQTIRTTSFTGTARAYGCGCRETAASGADPEPVIEPCQTAARQLRRIRQARGQIRDLNRRARDMAREDPTTACESAAGKPSIKDLANILDEKSTALKALRQKELTARGVVGRADKRLRRHLESQSTRGAYADRRVGPGPKSGATAAPGDDRKDEQWIPTYNSTTGSTPSP